MFDLSLLKKKRSLKGVCHPCSKLSERDVREIREKYAEGGISQSELAQKYRVSKGAIGRVVRREIWVDV